MRSPRDIAERPRQRTPEESRDDGGRLSGLVVRGLGLLTGLLVFALYLRTLAPTVLYYDLPDLRDSAALQVRAFALGIPDYTGYPTYVMLGKLFTYLPVGDVAYRVNLASAVYAALAVVFVYGSAVLLTRRVLPSVAGAVAFGVSPLFWSQAVIAEVYTLNALFVAAIVFVMLLWRESRRDRYLLLGAFLLGLTLTHHITSGLLIPAAFLFVFLTDRSVFTRLGLLLKGTLLFFVGLLPYLYLPIRASMDYLPDGLIWGQPLVREYPPNTFYGFYNLVSGGQWKERMWAFGPEEMPQRIELYLDRLYGASAGQFTVLLVLVGIGGAFYLAYRDRAATLTLAFLFAGWTFYALQYNIEDIEYYFIPTYIVVVIFSAFGLSGMIDLANRLPGGTAVRAASALAVGVLAVVLIAPGLRENYAANDMSDDYRGQEIIDAVAREAEPNATILHHRSPLDYMIVVEDRRTDVRLVPYLENPTRFGVARGILELDEGPVYVLFPGRYNTPYFLGVDRSRALYRYLDYELIPVDDDVLLYRVTRPDEERSQERRDTDRRDRVET